MKDLKNKIQIFSGIFILFYSLNSYSVNYSVADSSEYTLEEDLLKTNKAISDWFNSVTEGLDLFLAGKKVTNVESQSSIVLENTTYSRESKNFTNLTSLNVNPRLPNLEAYWNLKFTTYEDTTTSPRTERGYAKQTPKDKNYAATIGLFRKVDRVRFAFQPRIELQDPLKVSHSLSAESIFIFQKLKINPKLQFFASADKGTGTSQALNFNFQLNDGYSFTLINEGEYEDKLNRYSVTNGFSLGHEINDKTALSYGFSLYSNNRPNYHLDAYSLSITWSEVIYRKILDYQLTPHLDFVQDEQFRGFVGLVFGINLRF